MRRSSASASGGSTSRRPSLAPPTPTSSGSIAPGKTLERAGDRIRRHEAERGRLGADADRGRAPLNRTLAGMLRSADDDAVGPQKHDPAVEIVSGSGAGTA